MRPIVIGDFRRPDNISDPAAIEASNFPSTKQPVLHYPMQLPCDFIFLGTSEAKSRRRVRAK
jgi:hypothetical protein